MGMAAQASRAKLLKLLAISDTQRGITSGQFLGIATQLRHQTVFLQQKPPCPLNRILLSAPRSPLCRAWHFSSPNTPMINSTLPLQRPKPHVV